jgi:hypothetical protein
MPRSVAYGAPAASPRVSYSQTVRLAGQDYEHKWAEGAGEISSQCLAYLCAYNSQAAKEVLLCHQQVQEKVHMGWEPRASGGQM